jgi:hypothetical protein
MFMVCLLVVCEVEFDVLKIYIIEQYARGDSVGI